MSLHEALEKYLAFGRLKNKQSSMSSYYMHVRHLVLYFRNCRIQEVTFQDVISYMDLMTKIGWDRNSLVGKASAYKQFFTFWQGQGYVKWNAKDIPIPDVDHKFPRVLKEEDYKKLLQNAPKRNLKDLRNRVILQLLWDTGARLNEMLGLNVKDMDTLHRRAIIKTEKSRGVRPVRTIFWTKKTNEDLKEYIELRNGYLSTLSEAKDSGALLITIYGRWQTGVRMGESTVETVMKNLSHKASLGFIANPHSFRHSYGRNLALQGANNSTISDMMGHSDINSTRIYTVMNGETMQEQYNKFFSKR